MREKKETEKESRLAICEELALQTRRRKKTLAKAKEAEKNSAARATRENQRAENREANPGEEEEEPLEIEEIDK
jgi:hypothetical protein